MTEMKKNDSQTRKNSNQRKFPGPDLAEWILIGLLLFTIALTFRVNRTVSTRVLDNDASSELVLSKLLYEEKALYSNDWYYSTEINFHNQLIFGPLFGIFDGWSNVRFFGTCILQLLYLASFLYMMSQSGLGLKASLLGGILILLPFCVCYGRTVLYHCYYIPHYGLGFVMIGLMFSFIKQENAGKFSKAVRLGLLILIAFINSLLYVRQLFLTMVPVAGCLFFFIRRLTHQNKAPLRRWMFVPLIMLLAGGAGTIFNSRVLVPALALFEQTGQELSLVYPADLPPIIQAFVYQFSFRPGAKMFSLPGILAIGGVFNAVILIGSSCLDLLNLETEDFREFLLRTMFPVNLVLNMVIFLFGNIPFRLEGDYSRYLLAASVWMTTLLCSRVRFDGPRFSFHKALFTLCTLIFVGNGLFNARSFLHPEDFRQFYDGIVFDNPHQADDLRGAVDYIKAHDYDMGYAFIDEVNMLVEMTNGMPVVALLRIPNRLEYGNWLTRKSWKTLDADRAFFLMSAKLESYHREAPALKYAERVYFDDFGYVIYDISNLTSFRKEIAGF